MVKLDWEDIKKIFNFFLTVSGNETVLSNDGNESNICKIEDVNERNGEQITDNDLKPNEDISISLRSYVEITAIILGICIAPYLLPIAFSITIQLIQLGMNIQQEMLMEIIEKLVGKSETKETEFDIDAMDKYIEFNQNNKNNKQPDPLTAEDYEKLVFLVMRLLTIIK